MLAISKNSRGADLRCPMRFPELTVVSLTWCQFTRDLCCHMQFLALTVVSLTWCQYTRDVRYPTRFPVSTCRVSLRKGDNDLNEDLWGAKFQIRYIYMHCIGREVRFYLAIWCRFTKDLRCHTQLPGLTRLWLERRYAGAKLPAG